MFTPSPGDLILRASIGGAFHVVDATTQDRVAGPLPLTAALAYLNQPGVPHVFQQTVDLRGRLLGDPVRLEI